MKKVIDESSELWRSMFRIVDSMREQDNEVKDKMFYKLTFNQLRMIHRVYVYERENEGKGISLKMLAERLGITSAAASEMVDTLVKKEVLTRSIDPRDRRAISIVVAGALQERFLRSEAFYNQVAAGFRASLDDDTRRAFVCTLRRLADYTREKFAEDREGDK